MAMGAAATAVAAAARGLVEAAMAVVAAETGSEAEAMEPVAVARVPVEGVMGVEVETAEMATPPEPAAEVGSSNGRCCPASKLPSRCPTGTAAGCHHCGPGSAAGTCLPQSTAHS